MVDDTTQILHSEDEGHTYTDDLKATAHILYYLLTGKDKDQNLGNDDLQESFFRLRQVFTNS